MPNLIRTFVAVLIDPAVMDAVYSVQSRMREIAPHLKWVDSANFHFTVKFLGNIPEDYLPNVFEAVIKSAKEAEPFNLSITGTGVFGSPLKPRVVWAGTGEGANQLKLLAKSVDDNLQRYGFVPEERPFKAHLTLARSGKEEKALPEAFRLLLKEYEHADLGSTEVNSIVVMRSELKPGGSKYTPLAVFKLGNKIDC